MVAGKPVSVQSPARNRLLQSRCRDQAGAHSARASRRRSRGARARSARRKAARPSPGCLRDLAARSVRASSSRGSVSRRSAWLMVTEMRCRKAKIHSTVPLTTPVMNGEPAGGAQIEMRVDDGAELVRRLQARHQRGRGIGRHGEDQRVVRAERDLVRRRKRDGADLVDRDRDARSRARTGWRRPCSAGMPTPDRQRPCSGRRRNQRPAGLAAAQQRFAHDRGGEPRRAARRVDIERGEQQRLAPAGR